MPEAVLRALLPAPLRRRNFALLAAGTGVSQLGDGIYLVALAFQVYALRNSPGALAEVGCAWSLGMIACLLAGGVLVDRRDRRSIAALGAAIQLAAVGGMAALSLAGVIHRWEIVLLALAFGCGEGLAVPAADALLQEAVPEREAPSANAVLQTVRPLALQMIGPALGGAIVASAGPGWGLLLDAVTFACALACLAGMTPTRRPQTSDQPGSAIAEIREAARFVRDADWLWVSFLTVAVVVLVSSGPVEVLLPYLIKNSLHGTAGTFGLVLAAAGCGAIGGSVLRGRLALPAQPIVWMYVFWALAAVSIAGYALAGATWELFPLAVAFGFWLGQGNVLWGTLTQTRIPMEMRGRVSSLDWTIGLGLLPLSYALTAPAASVLGPKTMLFASGAVGATVVSAVLVGARSLRAPAAGRSQPPEPARDLEEVT